MKNAVSVKCSSFRYSQEGEEIFHNLEFDFNYGEVTLISGTSGCGKTTLISLINGVIPRVNAGEFIGEVLIDGKSTAALSMSQISRKVGSVLQNAESQIIHQIVEDEISFGCENFGFEPSLISKKIEQSCSIMKLQKDWKTRSLSGGQKQRLVTASTLAMDADILIFDEPLANLDVTGATILLQLLQRLCEEGKAVVLVEHRLDVVMPFVDKVWKLENKQAVLIQDKEKYLKSQTDIIEDKGNDCIKKGDTILKVQNVSKKFSNRNILEGISFEVYRGERILLSGENGSGKSTLMNIIARLLKADEGSAEAFFTDGASGKKAKVSLLKKWFKKCGVVYQNPNYQLFMDSVEKEILYGADDRDYALEIARRFNLDELMARHPHSLSEGQKRRVTIAAILAQKPELLLLDEPTVGQDYATLKRMMKVINEIHIENQNTMLSVTHDIRCISALCDRKLTIKDGKLI